MMRTPGGHSKLELTTYLTPAALSAASMTPRPTRWAWIASCSPSTASTTPSLACASSVPNSSARSPEAEARLRDAFDGLPLAPLSHGRDEVRVTFGDAVDDRRGEFVGLDLLSDGRLSG